MSVQIGDDLLKQLIGVLSEAGLLPPKCRRIVVDIQEGQPVRIYHDCFAEERFGKALVSSLMQVVAHGEVVSAWQAEEHQRREAEERQRLMDRFRREMGPEADTPTEAKAP